MNFEHIIASPHTLQPNPVGNLAEMIFSELPQRSENSVIIISHDENKYLPVTLPEYRSILLQLFNIFVVKGIKTGDTVMLASISGNNECFVAILFSALAAFGVRVLLPMFMDSSELDHWQTSTGFSTIIYPALEINSLEHYEKEKSLIKNISEFAEGKNLNLYDSLADFDLRELLLHRNEKLFNDSEAILKQVLKTTGEHTEALIITTSGSSGSSRLVLYDQGAFIRNCMSWEQAGFYMPDKFGGRGFTPLFTHTMGVRALFNALWSGNAVCLINTAWFSEKPETVRYLLSRMMPEHITGGPATFRLLLEMMRTFPELKSLLRPHMKTIISSGASFDNDLVSEIQDCFNTPVYNAFGTTETQQVLNSLLIPDSTPEERLSMGLPLPGVKIGLEKYMGKHQYKMHIFSPFACKTIISEHMIPWENTNFFYTGDIVSLSNGVMTYVGREESDFFKDGFGVKISTGLVKSYYAEAKKLCDHISIFPMINEPGLAAIIFQGHEHMKQEFSQTIETINENLLRELDPFSFKHYTLRRITMVEDAAPRTKKGSIAQSEIRKRYASLITELVSTFPSHSSIKQLKRSDDYLNTFTRFLNPYIGSMLHELKMDYIYHRGEKDSLFTYRNQNEIEVLDLTGGYGTNLLGHNHPHLTASLSGFISAGKVSLSNQGSIQEYAGELSSRLNKVLGKITGKNFRVRLGSTGAEVVEMSLAHACMEWRSRLEKLFDDQSQKYGGEAGELVRHTWEQNLKTAGSCRLKCIVSSSGFHGHTSGARSLLADTEKRSAFANILQVDPIYMNDLDPDWKSGFSDASEAAVIELKFVVYSNGNYSVESQKVSTIVAAIFEPLIGEGGIRTVDEEFLQFFSKFDFPLIMDEIQCGMGRTGSFLASEGIDSNYYLFAKALGGGLEKIGALLIESNRYQSKFDSYYSSTFANGELAAYTALKVLDLIREDEIPQKACEQGDRLLYQLEKIREGYPEVISSISGRGLMLGIHFSPDTFRNNIMLRILMQKKLLGYLFSSYLLNRHNIRILPSLSSSNVLRIEPSAYISSEEISRFCSAIEDLAMIVKDRKLYQLTKHLMDWDDFSDNKGSLPENGFFYSGIDKAAEGSVQVSFIGHFSKPTDELRAFEKDFIQASETGLRILFNKIQRLLEMEPVTLFSKTMFNGRIHFSCKIIPLDSAELERRHREGNRKKIIAQIQKAVNMAIGEGSKIISLGGYISILTFNGLALSAPDDVKIITGNTLTVATALQRVYAALKQDPPSNKKNVIAIVGAHGNIGSILSEQLVIRNKLFSEVILISRQMTHLTRFFERLKTTVSIPSDLLVTLETDLSCLRRCNVILISTNTNDPIIFPHHINNEEKVLIADNSIPAAVSKEVKDMPNVVNLPFASYIQLPQDPDFVIGSQTPQGTSFCCAAEAMLCGLDQVKIPLKGKITTEAVNYITRLAEKEGFFHQPGGVSSYKIF